MQTLEHLITFQSGSKETADEYRMPQKASINCDFLKLGPTSKIKVSKILISQS